MTGHYLNDDFIYHTSFDRWNQSELLANKLAERVCRHLRRTDLELDATSSATTKSKSAESETKTVVPNEKNEPSSVASKDDFTSPREHICIHMRKIEKVWVHYRKVKKLKN